MADASTTQLQVLIERMKSGDPSARDALLNHSQERLRVLTRKMLRDYARVKNWEDTSDVLQNANLRLLRALQAVPVGTVREFCRLAALQIRRELLDLARDYNPNRPGARPGLLPDQDNLDSTGPYPAERADTTNEPSRLAAWREFHERVETLPDEEREVFDLLWYQGLTQAEAAAALNVSESTVQRRWLSAKLRLQAHLEGSPPQ